MTQLEADAIRHINESLSKGRVLSEEDLRRLFAICAAAADPDGEISFEEIYASEEFRDLYEMVEDALFDHERSSSSMFEMGACWAFAGIVRSSVRRGQRQESARRIAKAVPGQLPLLRIVKDKPGITRAELERIEQDNQQVFQHLEAKGLVLSRPHGGCLHYYISALGEAVIRESEGVA